MKVHKIIINGHNCLVFRTTFDWYVVDTVSLTANKMIDYLDRIYGEKK